MKLHSQDYKDTVKKFGRELDSIITYSEGGLTKTLHNQHINSISSHYEGNILKSVMKQLDIDSNVNIPIDTVINYQFGVKIDSNYEYLDFGNYIVKKVEKKEDTNSWQITCYDKMINSMIDYEDLNITYPITIKNYISAICTKLNLTFANTNDIFANYDKLIQNELFLDTDGNSLGYTFRDVLDQLAEVTASTICINGDDELEIRYIEDTEDTINKEFLKDTNVSFGEKYGPINTIVLSRSAGGDNVYYPDPLPEDPVEIKISDNQIMNGNDRSEYLPDIYNKLNGLEYYINNFSSTGITYYDLCDKYNVQIDDKVYPCIMFNDQINITQGLEEIIYADMPEQSETEYQYADSTDKRLNRTIFIVDKHNQIIQSIVENTTYVSDTKSGNGTITLENAHKGQLYKLVIKGNITKLFPQNANNLYGYSLAPSDTLTPSNSLTPSNPVPYDNHILYPSSTLYPVGTILTIDNTEYNLDLNFLNYINNDICDEFVYENGNSYIIRRVGIDNQGNKYPLDNEVIEPRKTVNLQIDTNSVITLNSFSNANLSATYLLENIYTDNFATQVDVKSSIEQTARTIMLVVNGKTDNDEIIASLNLAVEKGQGIVKLKGNSVEIDSDYFKLLPDGSVEATNGNFTGNITSSNATITGGDISLTGASTSVPKMTVAGTGDAGYTDNTKLYADGLKIYDSNNNLLGHLISTKGYQNRETMQLKITYPGLNRGITIDPEMITFYRGSSGNTIIGTNEITTPGTLFIGSTARIDGATEIKNNLTVTNGNVRVDGDLYVTGSKLRIVKVNNNKMVGLNAYETATPYFGDIGSNQTNNEGSCKIEIENIFSQTIEKDDYKVFIQECGDGHLYVEKYKNYFVVKGTPNLQFDWEIKAIQKGYKDVRLKERE